VEEHQELESGRPERVRLRGAGRAQETQISRRRSQKCGWRRFFFPMILRALAVQRHVRWSNPYTILLLAQSKRNRLIFFFFFSCPFFSFSLFFFSFFFFLFFLGCAKQVPLGLAGRGSLLHVDDCQHVQIGDFGDSVAVPKPAGIARGKSAFTFH